MFTTKTLFGLLAIAAGGIVNNTVNQPFQSPPVDAEPSLSAAQPDVDRSRVRGDDGMQSAARSAVLAAIRTDLHDNNSSLRLSEFRFDAASSETVEGNSRGQFVFDGASSIPIVATVLYDVPKATIESVRYSLAEKPAAADAGQVGPAMRQRISDVIGSRLVMEFSQQPVDFSLLNVRSIASGPARLLVDGDGVTRFAGEGAAYTRFFAVAEKSTGRIVSIKYDLQQDQENGANSLAKSN